MVEISVKILSVSHTHNQNQKHRSADLISDTIIAAAYPPEVIASLDLYGIGRMRIICEFVNSPGDLPLYFRRHAGECLERLSINLDGISHGLSVAPNHLSDKPFRRQTGAPDGQAKLLLSFFPGHKVFFL